MGSSGITPAAPRQRSRGMLLLVGPLVLLIALLVRAGWNGAREGAAATTRTVEPARPGQAVAKAQTHSPAVSKPIVRRVEVTWPVVAVRNPFHSERVFPPAPVQKAVDTGPKQPDADAVTRDVRQRLHLTAVFLGDHPKAVINGRLYAVGQSAGGCRITRIRAREVTVLKDGVPVTLHCD